MNTTDKFMENSKDNGICIVPKGMLQYQREVISMSEDSKNLLNKVYRDISEELGLDAAMTIHHMFKGTQVCFPVKFFDPKYVKEMIVQEYDGKNTAMLAKKYDYSEKTVRRIIRASLKKPSDN